MFDRNKKQQLTGLLALSLALILILAACSGQTNNSPANSADTGSNTGNQTDAQNEMAENTSADNTTENDGSGNEMAESGDGEDAGTSNSSGEAEAPAQMEATVSFSADVKPIIDSRCATCHGIDRIEGGLVMLTYEELMQGGEDGQVIIPGDAGGSLLVQLIESGKMPKRGPKVTPVELEVIRTWVNEGAQNN